MSRNQERQLFLQPFFTGRPYRLEAITGDASYRRYFRVSSQNASWILMDSEPSRVDNHPYLALNQVFRKQGFILPEVVLRDDGKGLFLLSDLGSTHLADLLDDDKARPGYYRELIDLMAAWAQTPSAPEMKPYDAGFVALELNIFREWLVEGLLSHELSVDEVRVWEGACKILVENIAAQPKVTMHRDFHSRNLMKTAQGWAVIDYQDAVQGPVSYDLVSLLRDCYVRLPEGEFSLLLRYGFERLQGAGLLGDADFEIFRRWFDLTGIQRHLKAAGIFCRLNLRDGKQGYLPHILPTLDYVTEVADGYPELAALASWVRSLLPDVRETLCP